MRIKPVYVPLDVNTTVSRLMKMMVDCEPPATVVDHATSREAATLDPRHECLPPRPRYGETLVIVPRRLRDDPAAISKLTAQEIITHTGATASEHASWIQCGFSEPFLLCQLAKRHGCGEQCPPTLIEGPAKLSLSGLQLCNAYGPSEAIIGTTDTVLSLGKPRSAKATRPVPVLDNDAKPAPTGAAGQICIGGAGTLVILAVTAQGSTMAIHEAFARVPESAKELVLPTVMNSTMLRYLGPSPFRSLRFVKVRTKHEPGLGRRNDWLWLCGRAPAKLQPHLTPPPPFLSLLFILLWEDEIQQQTPPGASMVVYASVKAQAPS
ncbi:hypothetical protein DL768_009308 [Monosporascus sp. mg162]|nr:hypothetical protein DL768_009308 [Monosporascus sp. mg162]